MIAVWDLVLMWWVAKWPGGIAPGGKLSSAFLAAVALDIEGDGGGEYSCGLIAFDRVLAPIFRSTDGNVWVEPRAEPVFVMA